MLRTYRTDEVPALPFERAMFAAVHTEPNTIAGRPNACNFSLDFIQRGAAAQRSIVENYYLHCLEMFFPNVSFRVEALDTTDAEGWQAVLISYSVD